MAVRWREAGGGPGTGSAGESPYAELERALREAYEAARSGRQEQLERRVELLKLGGLLVEVYVDTYWSDAVIFKVLKCGRGCGGDEPPLCSVELKFEDGEPYEFEVDCDGLKNFASGCAGGGGCALSWEEMERALGLAGLAANVLAKLAGAPVNVKGTGLVEAYDTRNGKPRVLPCLQVSVKGESYSVCQGLRLSRNPGGGWRVKGLLRLVPIGKHARVADALMELGEMMKEYVENLEREGAKSTYASKHRGEFLVLDEVVLRRPDGTKEVLLVPWFYKARQESWFHKLNYIGEDFAVVYCPANRSKISDSELADAVKKDLEEAWGVVVQAVRRYMETGDPRLITFAYITAEAVRRAGLAPA